MHKAQSRWKEHWGELKRRSVYLSLSLALSFGYLFNNIDRLIDLSWQWIECVSRKSPSDSGDELKNAFSAASDASTTGLNFSSLQSLIYTEITEGFWSYISLTTYVVLISSIPLVYYLVYGYLRPGLYKSETQRVKLYLSLSVVVLILSSLVSLIFLLPRATEYFLTYQSMPQSGLSEAHLGYTQDHVSLSYLGKLYSWVSFVISLHWYVLLVFHLPLLGFICIESLSIDLTRVLTPFIRKLLFFSLLVLSALLSPPDVLSLFICLIPLVFLVEAAVYILVFVNSFREWKNINN